MNDDINDILNVSDSTTNDIIDNEQGIQDEKNLKKIAGIILIIGIILSLILLFSIAIVTVDGGYSSESKTVLNSTGLVVAIGTLLTSIGLWSFLRVISNISLSLKELIKK